MSSATRNFYSFVGFHSFLIGLFPFYLPVYLWKSGLTFTEISIFIALSGAGFCLSLRIWEILYAQGGGKPVIILSYLLELLLLFSLLYLDLIPSLLFLGLLNGAYNCFFWTTNRVLFTEATKRFNTGKNFGNFQILVAVLLKVGVFAGGLTLDRYGIHSIFILSLAFVLLLLPVLLLKPNRSYRPALPSYPISLKKLVRFKDPFRSLPIFLLDGLFLYLESYFWLISIFLLVKESFWSLGLLVMLLMLLFSLLFLGIKNHIDTLPQTTVYRIAVVLYILSWLIRGTINDQIETVILFILLILISFSTAFFRLCFYKRFFDLAFRESSYTYLIRKSYISQFFIIAWFAGLYLISGTLPGLDLLFQGLYFSAAVLASGYFFYRNESETYVIPSLPKETG